VAEFCSHVICSKLPSSGYNRCLDEVSRNCWTSSAAVFSNVPTDVISNDNDDREPLADECDQYDECLSLVGKPRPDSVELADPEEMVVLDMENGAESDKRWGEGVRPLKRWSERLKPCGKKWVTFCKSHSPKRWSERLKNSSRKWSEWLKQKWCEDEHGAEDTPTVEQDKKRRRERRQQG